MSESTTDCFYRLVANECNFRYGGWFNRVKPDHVKVVLTESPQAWLGREGVEMATHAQYSSVTLKTSTVQSILKIAKLICSVTGTVCPAINALPDL